MSNRMESGSLKGKLGITETVCSAASARRVVRFLRQNIAAGKYDGSLRKKAVAYVSIYNWMAVNKFGGQSLRKARKTAAKAPQKRARKAKATRGRPKGSGLNTQLQALRDQVSALQALVAQTTGEGQAPKAVRVELVPESQVIGSTSNVG